MTILKLGVVIAGMAITAGCSTSDTSAVGVPPPPVIPVNETSAEVSESLPIAEGDRLEVVVREDPSLKGNYEVREGGHIMIGTLGRVQVEGLTLRQAEQTIKASLEKDQLTTATVIVDRLGRAPRSDPRVTGDKIITYMTGNVNRPGQHVLTLPQGRSLGVYEAILITGGLGSYANERQVHLLRADEENRRHRIPVDIKAIKEGLVPDVMIGNGDVVVVPEKTFGF